MKLSLKWIILLLVVAILLGVVLLRQGSRTPAEPLIPSTPPESDMPTVQTPPVPAPDRLPPSAPETAPIAPREAVADVPAPHQPAPEPGAETDPAEPPPLEPRPPFVGPEGRPMQASVQEDTIRNMARRIQVDAGPEARQHARGLLEAEGEDLGLVGVALLLEETDWEADLMKMIVDHPDVAVPLYAWQGLRDQGRFAEADALTDSLANRMGNLGEQLEAISQAQFPGTAARGMVDFALATGDASVLEALVVDDSADYSGRMSALMALEHVLPFAEYRNRVYAELSHEERPHDPVWSEGLQRLAERLEGPVEVHSASRVIVPADVDIMLAREHPATLEDLALHLEHSEKREGTRFGPGTIERLHRLQQDAQNRPLADGDRIALQRIAALADRIQESDLSDIPPPTPPMGEAQP